MPQRLNISRQNYSYKKYLEESERPRLKEANENEQLRRVFNTAVDEFSKLKRRVEQLQEQLDHEKEQNKHLEKKNQLLEHELSNERAKANKFASMLFGLKSERLKLSEIKIEDENSVVLEENTESEINNVEAEKSADVNEQMVAEKDGEKKKKRPEVRMGIKEVGGKSLKNCRLWTSLFHYLKEKSFMEFLRRNG